MNDIHKLYEKNVHIDCASGILFYALSIVAFISFNTSLPPIYSTRLKTTDHLNEINSKINDSNLLKLKLLS